MTCGSHPPPVLFALCALQTFHTPSLGDEEFEIPPISLDPDTALTVSDVVSHFGELSDPGPPNSVSMPGNSVVEGDDPSFASTFVSASSQGLEHLSLGVMSQSGGGALLGSSLGMVRNAELNVFHLKHKWPILLFVQSKQMQKKTACNSKKEKKFNFLFKIFFSL